MSETIEKPTETDDVQITPDDIHMPSPSYWPITLAFGFTMIIGGLAISLPATLIGIITVLVATIGWVIEPAHPEGEH